MVGSVVAGENWPDYRGPGGQGHSDATGLPMIWSETQNIKWKTPTPGRGWSSPVVWGDQVWMTAANEDGTQRFALCMDRNTGKVLHEVKVLDVATAEEIHSLNSYASPSPVIEKGRVYVYFGTQGTACLDTATGEVLWKRTDIHLDHQLGPGSSPVLFNDLLIFHCDGRDLQYIIALDKRTGRTVWKTSRSNDLSPISPNMRKAFCTPLIVESRSGPQMVSVGPHAMFGYDPRSGQELWRVRYSGFSNVARPLAGEGMVFISTGYEQPEFLAIKLGGSGDVTDSHVAWSYKRNIPQKPSPVLVEGLIYMVNDSGIATCLEAKTGAEVWKQRIGGEYSTASVYADGRIYFFSQEGKATVIAPGRQYRELAVNKLDEGFMASPAIAGKAFYLRTKTHLYRIEQ